MQFRFGKHILLALGLLAVLNSSVRAATPEESLEISKKVKFVNVPLEDALAQLQDLFQVKIEIAEGLNGTLPVNFEGELQLYKLLARVLAQCGLKYHIGADAFTVVKMSLKETLNVPTHAKFVDTSLESALFFLSKQFGIEVSIANGIDRKRPIRGHATGKLTEVLRRILVRNNLAATIQNDTIVIVPLKQPPTPEALVEDELKAYGRLTFTSASLETAMKSVSDGWNIKVAIDDGVDKGLQVNADGKERSLQELLALLLQPLDLAMEIKQDTLLILPYKEPEVALEAANKVDFVEVELEYAMPYLQELFQVKIEIAEDVNRDLRVTCQDNQKLKEVLAKCFAPCGLKYKVEGNTIIVVMSTLKERLELQTNVQFRQTRLDDAISFVCKGNGVKATFGDGVNRHLMLSVDATGEFKDVLAKLLAPYNLTFQVDNDAQDSLLIVRLKPPTSRELLEETLAAQAYVFDFSETPLEDAVKSISETYRIKMKIGDGVNQLLRPGKGAGATLRDALTDLLKRHGLRIEVRNDTLMIVR